MTCKVCNGKQVVYDPPEEVQIQEAEEGKRQYATYKPCVCLVEENTE